jgi:hypothetical protein
LQEGFCEASGTTGTVAGRLLEPQDSGGASAICATATSSSWVHAPQLEKPSKQGPVTACSPLHFPADGKDHHHLQQEKNAQTVDFNFIFSFSNLVLSPFQIHLIYVFSLPPVLDLTVVVRGR